MSGERLSSTSEELTWRKAGEPKGKSAEKPPTQPPKCPECGSQKVWKDGLRYVKSETGKIPIQRFLCRSCGRRFSETTLNPESSPNLKVEVNIRGKVRELLNSPEDFLQPGVFRGHVPVNPSAKQRSFKVREDVASHDSSKGTTVGKVLNTFGDYNRNHQVSVKEAKNLVRQLEKQKAGEPPSDTKSQIINFLWYMQKQGYSETTIKKYGRCLHKLTRNNVNLENPEDVKAFLAKQSLSAAYKNIITAAYTLYLKTQDRKWDAPTYNVTRKIPFIPTEKELDALIAACGKKTATFLQLLKETAARRGEICDLQWTDVDFERHTVNINNPEKHGNPRIVKITGKLERMLNMLPRTSKYVFGNNNRNTRSSVFYTQRKRIARKLGNPRLLKIGFHTFRHWKATMLYHQTKDIVYVKEFLGHKNIDTTLLYVQLEKTLFQGQPDAFIVKATKKPEKMKELLEAGFEYVCDKDGLMFFRKRK